MRRSGHHAIINWLISNLELNRFTVEWWNNLPLEKYLQHCKFVFKSRYRTEGNPDYCIVNHEDDPPRSEPLMEHKFSSGGTRPVLILRDAYNCLASRMQVALRKGTLDGSMIKRDIALWKQYAQHFLENDSFFKIVYNHWIAREDYRKERLLALLGPGNYTDHYSKITATAGGGSSFFGTEYQAGFEERYKLIHDKQYARVLEDKKLAEWNEKIFGWHLEKGDLTPPP